MTFLEKIKLEKPDMFVVCPQNLKDSYAFGCPCAYEYENSFSCPDWTNEDKQKYKTHCEFCWNREIPEEEPASDVPFDVQTKQIPKGENKTMKLAAIIRDSVLNAICDRDIEEAVKEAFEEYDYSDMITSAVEDYLHYNIEDIAHEIVEEAVHEYFTENL